MQPNKSSAEAKRQVEQLLGRIDAVQGEINQAKREVEQFSHQDKHIEAREAQADVDRLLARKRQLEMELQKLKKFW